MTLMEPGWAAHRYLDKLHILEQIRSEELTPAY